MTIHPDYTPDTADYYAAWEESADRFAPDWRDLTDESLHIASAHHDAMREGAPHSFTGIDGRCHDCDVRPYSRHASGPCKR